MINKIEWFACAFGIIGAFVVASNTALSSYGYIPFLLGSLGYCYVANARFDAPLLLLNIIFVIANTLGIIKWIIL